MKHYYLIISFIFCSLMLSACVANHHYQQPKLGVVHSYTKEGDIGQIDDQHIAITNQFPIQWWLAFDSIELNQLVEEALKNNHDFAIAKERVVQAQQDVRSASSAYWPEISLSASSVRQKYGVAFLGNIATPAAETPFTAYMIGPNVTYDLGLFGRTHYHVEQAKALHSYQKYEREVVWLTITGNVVLNAFKLAALHDQLSSLDNIIQNDEKNLALIEKAMQIGSASQIDLLRAKSQLANDQAMIAPLRQQYNITEHALAILMGKSPAEWSTPSFDLEHFKLPGELPLQLPSELVHHRPDILAAEAQLHAASARVGIAKANRYPNLILQAATNQQSLTIHNLFLRDANVWNMAANLTAPIFNAGQLRAQQRAAKSMYNEALHHYQQTIIEAFGQVADVLRALQHDSEELNSQKSALQYSKNALQLAQKSYEYGEASTLDLLDAERVYNQTIIAYTRTRLQQYQDTVQFFIALGGQAPSTDQKH